MRYAIARRTLLGWMTAALVVLIGCGPAQSPTPTAGSASPQTGATIEAQPNPVPGGSGLGTTTITWRTGDGADAQVYVAEGNGSETLLSAGPEGSEQANWIRAGTSYDFRLYAGTDHKTLLGTVKVTRAT